MVQGKLFLLSYILKTCMHFIYSPKEIRNKKIPKAKRNIKPILQVKKITQSIGLRNSLVYIPVMAFLAALLSPRLQRSPFRRVGGHSLSVEVNDDDASSTSPLGAKLGKKLWELRTHARAKIFDYTTTMKSMSVRCEDLLTLEELLKLMSENAKIISIEELVDHLDSMHIGDVIRAFNMTWIIVDSQESKDGEKVLAAKVVDGIAPTVATQILRERGGNHYEEVSEIQYYIHDKMKYCLHKSQDISEAIFVNGVRVVPLKEALPFKRYYEKLTRHDIDLTQNRVALYCN